MMGAVRSFASALARAAGALAGAAPALALLAACSGGDGGRAELRPAPVVPQPGEEEKILYFYRIWTSGAQQGLAGAQIPIWREIGENALLAMGKPALDFLLSEERYAQYKSSPDILANLLRALPRSHEAATHPRLYPFLLYWLDPSHAPPPTPSGNWAEDWRRDIFLVFKTFPDQAAVAACRDELTRKKRTYDLRAPAASTLLATGQGRMLNELYASLPPNEEDPESTLRIQLLLRVCALAAPGAGEQSRAQARELEPLLRTALKGKLTVERFNAMGGLLRLGDTGMERELVRFFQKHQEDEMVAWSALVVLAQDGPHPFVKEVCEKRVASGEPGIGLESSVDLLMKWWPPEHAATAWSEIAAGRVPAMRVLVRLLAADRENVVAYLRGEVRRNEAARVGVALRFIRGERVTELGMALKARVRELPPERRPPFYKTLTALRTAGTEALLLAELKREKSPLVKDAAITELLNLGGEEGLARLRSMLEGGDAMVLAALFRRARRGGRAGLPDTLLPAIFAALTGMPGEEERRAALLVLRYRGSPEGVLDGLRDAYRHEPSRRFAAEIRQVIEELAHR